MYSSETTDEARDDLAAFGAPAELINELKKAEEDSVFEVFEENWLSLAVFLRLDTQWRASYGGVYGLDYNVIPFVFKMLKIKNQAKVFDDIRLMEREALTILNKKKG